jgi:molecular chaperone DnaK (HSP70)
LQHRLLLNSEGLKKRLVDAEAISFEVDYLMNPIKISIARSDIRKVCEGEIIRILQIVKETLSFRDTATKQYRVFMTGGMSISNGVVDAVQEVISPGIAIRRIPALRSVVAGLTVVARQLSLSQSIHTEPSSVRGIPIER